eukprot:1964210-Rhodomonas_salina.1
MLSSYALPTRYLVLTYGGGAYQAVELHAHTHVQHAPRILAALQKSLIDPQTSLAGPPKSLSAPQKATAMVCSAR